MGSILRTLGGTSVLRVRSPNYDALIEVAPRRPAKSPVRRVSMDSSQPAPSTPEGPWLTMPRRRHPRRARSRRALGGGALPVAECPRPSGRRGPGGASGGTHQASRPRCLVISKTTKRYRQAHRLFRDSPAHPGPRFKQVHNEERQQSITAPPPPAAVGSTGAHPGPAAR